MIMAIIGGIILLFIMVMAVCKLAVAMKDVIEGVMQYRRTKRRPVRYRPFRYTNLKALEKGR